MKLSALLLSGSLGMGHDVLAQACAGSLEARGWSTGTLDAMRLLGARGSLAGEAVFRSMLAVPGAFDAFHFAALRSGSWPALLADAAARHPLVPRLREHLDAGPPDLAISVFATAASAVSALADSYPAMSHLVFCSDVTPHRLWVHRNVDLYLVTSRAAEAAVQRFQPEARIAVVPMPVRPAFYAPPAQARARASLGLPGQARCVLLMSGGWGLGPLAQAAAGLAAAGLEVLAVAGRNGRLERRLRAAARYQRRLHVFGFTDRIPELMAAADLVITSSGDTCSEARVVGRPLLLLDVVQGHGRDNLQHELELGDAWVTSARPADVVRNALAAVDRVKHPSESAAGAPVRGRSLADWEASFSVALATLGF
ncbi:MAG TPA: glycosyltransferase [Streptosporangiaceae bacterium]|nr:glycosyltransferase [Streptosporangiaceae bacterium]